MGRIKKKGESGAAKNYITRTQAVRKLQISLPDFRKLCIWKGIYPREPRNKKKVSKSATASTTFYYTKDIQYLLHEPLLAKFRDQKVLEKKITRALGRGDVSDAKRLEGNAARPENTGKPLYTLDHVIRERYPTFVDSLRDLDDCLSMLFLFANLPATASVPAKMIARCERLCLEFQHYLIVSHSLQKSFLSIKGIYYQANIQGEDILWLVPYKFNQRVVGDIDFRIMGTFIEFYMTLLGFVNFRLYTSLGLKYPPKFDAAKDDKAADLAAFTLEGAGLASNSAQPDAIMEGTAESTPDPKLQAKVNKLVKELKNGEEEKAKAITNGNDAESELAATDGIDKFEPAAPGGDVLLQPSYSTTDPSQLFANCTIYLSREAPRQALEFILRAFGCKRIGWDEVLGDGAFTTNELDPSITHQIVDRPPVAAVDNDEGEDAQTSQKVGGRVPGRTYVQPQWVWDSVNDEELKEPNQYAPGAQLPPHLSPFVKARAGQYDPTVPLEEQQTEAEALRGDSDIEDEEDADDAEVDDDDEAVKAIEDGEMDVAGSDDDDDEAQVEDGFGGFSDGEEGAEPLEDDEDASAALQRQLELEAEFSGKSVKASDADKPAADPKAKAKQQKRKELERKAKEEAEDLERAKGMLSKKKRKLFEQMTYSNNKKDVESEKLREKRRRYERNAAKGKAE